MLTSPANPITIPTHLPTVDAFEQWERQHPHEGSYEFVRGRIIPKPAMKQDEVDIADFLIRQFMQTPQFAQKHTLMPEVDAYVDLERRRRPDLLYLTNEQRQAIRRGERVPAYFAIELLSDSESYDYVLEKLQDYFDGGAQLVWYIVPKRQKIFAYTSPDESKAYKGQEVISAAPVVPEFEFVVADMFE
ncbi:Uma2 family endonuclease [Spirosoma spitsbergense]|uniref:Uma2 family endonuclease n=1 Tax=Spirosoma spitsbergense TaxID=431554 RepID=UPI00035C1C4A|nr:Uma2 family endonuclease [Spirosoma spitsbergense]